MAILMIKVMYLTYTGPVQYLDQNTLHNRAISTTVSSIIFPSFSNKLFFKNLFICTQYSIWISVCRTRPNFWSPCKQCKRP